MLVHACSACMMDTYMCVCDNMYRNNYFFNEIKNKVPFNCHLAIAFCQGSYVFTSTCTNLGFAILSLQIDHLAKFVYGII